MSDLPIAGFDSASAFLRATANYLKGEDFPALGLNPAAAKVAPLVNLLPKRFREMVYTYGGFTEAAAPGDLSKVRSEAIAEWACRQYPRRQFPAVMIGSSNGALVHLCAALDVPWLPQTVLLPVRETGADLDEPRKGMEAAREPARLLLDNNPDLQLHHMRDPVQDHLMLQVMTYFRVKRLRLGRTYERFLSDVLKPGGTIFLVECGQRWPTTRVDERHLFQFGAVGGAKIEELFQGGQRVMEFLQRYDSERRAWDPPEPDGESPEAEWGFEPALQQDVERFASERGYRIVRLVFGEPQDMSPLVADFYHWRYRERGIEPNRLLVESFILMEPWWALRTGCVPFWMTFNTENDLAAVEDYLDNGKAFDFIHLTLFPNGTEGIGQPSMDAWRAFLARACREGSFAGVDPDKFPQDFAALTRYHTAIKKLAPRHPLPGPLPLDTFYEFLAETKGRYAVQWYGLGRSKIPA